jgi:hypothetical protein
MQLFRDLKTFAHIPCRNNLPITRDPTSTAFCSINYHLGGQLSFRDDIESLAYLLIYIVRGSLPWLALDTPSNDVLLQQKQNTTVVELCDSLPPTFATCLTYARELSFEQKPNYSFLLSLFRDLRANTPHSAPILSDDAHNFQQTYWGPSRLPFGETPHK